MKTRDRIAGFYPRLFAAVLIIAVSLASCSSAKTSTTNGTPQAQNPAGNGSLPAPTQLALGTLKLEGTDQAVTVEQAAELLTLWQAYQALSNSDTTAAVELEAVIKQIQGAMTSEQIKAIEAMQLNAQSVSEVLQSMGPGIAANATPRAQRTPRSGQTSGGGFDNGGPDDAGGPPGGGGFPAGGRGGDGGSFPADGGGGFSAQGTPNATAQARFSAQATRGNPMVLNALIRMLEAKIQPALTATPTP